MLTQPKYLTVQDVSVILGVSKSFLNKLRVSGQGPFYLKIGARVVYDINDIDEWARARRRANTVHTHSLGN